MSIMVNREEQVVVRVPYGVTLAEIDAFVQGKRVWLNRKITELKARTVRPASDSFLLSKEVLYLGDVYPLYMDQHHSDAKDVLRWSGHAFHLSCREPATGKTLLARWYVRQAEELFPGRVAQYAKLMDVFPKNVRISSARCRWGSCSARKRVSLSWRLMMAPPAVIDSVIVHELAHLKEMNHSLRFWSFVRTYCPEYDRYKKWLKTEGRYLMEF